MSPWKIGGGALAAAAVGLGLIALSHHARAQEDAAAHAAPSDAQMAEHHRRLAALMGVVLAETDFEAMDAHIAALIRANAEEIGGDPEALIAHVHGFLGQAAEHAAADPQAAGQHLATMLIEAHRHH